MFYNYVITYVHIIYNFIYYNFTYIIFYIYYNLINIILLIENNKKTAVYKRFMKDLQGVYWYSPIFSMIAKNCKLTSIKNVTAN